MCASRRPRLEDEVRASFRAYESLWRAREDQLASISLILSRLPSVRSAFSTGDGATIRDSASEVWDQLSRPETLFLVCDPNGVVIASVAGPQGKEKTAPQMSQIAIVRSAAREFPKQARGFVTLGDRLYQIVITPVYVATTQDPALLNVLVAGIAVDADLAGELKNATGGSDFVFLAHGSVAASTLDPDAERALAAAGSSPRQVQLLGSDYLQFTYPLTDVDGNSVGELRILRSFKGALNQITAVRSRLAVLWLGAVLAGIGVTYLLARRLLKPVDELDRAAAEIATGNYDVRVPVHGGGEIARLAETFNSMCASLSKAREDLIRQERIATIGRLSTSIIHDLRNPLAAIYGGAEMLVDTKLSGAQVERLAANIYRASRQVQSLLQELADVTQGRAHAREVCRLREVVTAAYEPSGRHCRVPRRHGAHRPGRRRGAAAGPLPDGARVPESAEQRHRGHAQRRVRQRPRGPARRRDRGQRRGHRPRNPGFHRRSALRAVRDGREEKRRGLGAGAFARNSGVARRRFVVGPSRKKLAPVSCCGCRYKALASPPISASRRGHGCGSFRRALTM